MGPIVAFTGHRPDKLGGDGTFNLSVSGQIVQKLLDLDPSHAISGMALGVDQMAARLCLLLDIPFTAAIPFEGQEERWPKFAQARYRWLLARAAKVEIVSPHYSIAAMQRRNEWMVDQADALIAVWNGSSGGTANCVRYAKLMGLPVHLIDTW